MVKVYFEMEGSSELVAIFDNEEAYFICYPELDRLRKRRGFDMITESIVDQQIIELKKSIEV